MARLVFMETTRDILRAFNAKLIDEAAAVATRAREVFEGLTDEGRAYCARYGADEYAQSETTAVRTAIAKLAKGGR